VLRQLPSAKVCFLGGCPRSGRNQDPVGALPRSRRPPCRRALDCLHSRCLRVKAAEEGVKATTPLRWDLWRPKFRGCGTREIALARLIWKGRADQYVNAPIRGRLIVLNTAAKRGTSSANGEYIELPQTRVKVSSGHAAGKNGCSPQGKPRC